MPEMAMMNERDAFALLCGNLEGQNLVGQIADSLLRSDLTIREVNAVLVYAWYAVMDIGKFDSSSAEKVVLKFS